MSLPPAQPINAPLNHIAFIMDGNGRWAQQRNKPRTDGHKEGVKRVLDVTRHAFEHWHIPYLTFYAFSTENWTRPKHEIHIIFQLLRLYMRQRKQELIQNQIRVRIIGDRAPLPKALQQSIEELLLATSHFREHTLTIALNYGARDEVMRAIRSLKPDELPNLTWENFSTHLDTTGIPDPDLIVRTSGEQRLSNFLLLQAAYCELYFPKVHWPDFTPDELDEAIAIYQQRTRRFGAL